MAIARIALASVLAFAACKDKQEAKPAPAETKPVVAETPKPTEAPPQPVGKPGDPPPEAKPAETKPLVIKAAGGFNTQAEYEAKANELMTKLLAVFQQAGTNCDKLADAINKFADTNKAVLAGAEEFAKANPDAEKQLNEKMKSRQQEIAGKLGPSMQACQNHKGLQTAMSKIDN